MSSSAAARSRAQARCSISSRTGVRPSNRCARSSHQTSGKSATSAPANQEERPSRHHCADTTRVLLTTFVRRQVTWRKTPLCGRCGPAPNEGSPEYVASRREARLMPSKGVDLFPCSEAPERLFAALTCFRSGVGGRAGCALSSPRSTHVGRTLDERHRSIRTGGWFIIWKSTPICTQSAGLGGYCAPLWLIGFIRSSMPTPSS
jgi:hypothetical protein